MLFRNQSERRLWLTAAALQAAIFLSLSLGDNVVRFLRGSNLLRVAVGLALVAVVIAVAALLRRAGVPPRTMMIAAGLLGVYALALLRIERPEERLHLVEYGAVTALIFAAVRARYLPRRRLALALVIAFLAGAALGWLDEGIQYLLPDRVYEIGDVLLNVQAAGLAAGACWLLFRSARVDA